MLLLPEIFKKDIQDKITSINPFIVVGWDIDLNAPGDRAVLISTNKELFDGYQFIDANLNIKYIKEKMDIEKRKMVLNNLSMTLSNYNNISERLSELDMTNIDVAVFWKSQSAKTLNDCMLIYLGSVVRYSHDDKTVSIKLEDRTSLSLNKEIPIANIGTGPRVYNEKYVNKPIPMAYGNIPKAPGVIWKLSSGQTETGLYSVEENDSGFHVIGDDVFNSVDYMRNITGQVFGAEGLIIYKGDGDYWTIYGEPNIDFDDRLGDGDSENDDEPGNYKGFENNEQVRVYDGYAYFLPKTYNNMMAPNNPISNNLCLAWLYKRPSQVKTGDAVVFEEDGELGLWTEYLGPSRGLLFSNPDAMVDKTQSPEALALGLDPKDTYTRFPDNDVDSIYEFEGYPETDYSYDMRNFLESTFYGNFLEYIPLEIGFTTLGSNSSIPVNDNIYASSGSRINWNWPMTDDGNDSNAPASSHNIPLEPPHSPFLLTTDDLPISYFPPSVDPFTGEITDDNNIEVTSDSEFSAMGLCRHGFQWVPGDGWFGNNNDQYFTGYGFSATSGPDTLGDVSQGIYVMEAIGLSYFGLGGSVMPFARYRAEHGFTPGEMGGQYAHLSYHKQLKYAYQSDWNMALVQVPNHITMAAELQYYMLNELGIELNAQWYTEMGCWYGHPDYGTTCDIYAEAWQVSVMQNPDIWEGSSGMAPGNYLLHLGISTEITGASMHHEETGGMLKGAELCWAINSDNQWGGSLGYYSRHTHEELTDYQVTKSGYGYPLYPSMPMILDAEPYGDQIWYFGYEWEWVEEIPVVGELGTFNIYEELGIKVPVFTKYVAVNFSGELTINKMAYTDVSNTTQYESPITHVVSLADIHDFSKYAVLSAVQRDGSSASYASLENLSAYIKNRYHWNGSPSNVSNDGVSLGMPGSLNITRPVFSSDYVNGYEAAEINLYEGGETRMHFLTTSPTGTGEPAGCLLPPATPYIIATSEGNVGNVTWSYKNQINYGYPQSGLIAHYNSEEWGYLALGFEGSEENEYNQEVMLLKLIYPNVGDADSAYDSFRVHFKYKFNIQTKPEELEQLSSIEDGILDTLKLGLFAYGANTEFDGNWNSGGGFSKTTEHLITFQEFIDLADSEGNVMWNNVDPEDYGNALQFSINPSSQYSEHNAELYEEEGHSADLFWTGFFPRDGGEPWTQGPNEYKDVNLRVEISPYWGTTSGNIAVPFPFNMQIYEVGLHFDGVFKDLDAADFYLKDYSGRTDTVGLVKRDGRVIEHIMRNELMYGGTMDQSLSGDVNDIYNLGFSITETGNAKEIIEDICTNTCLFPRVKGVDEFSLGTIKSEYSFGDVNRVIDEKDCIKIKFNLTKIEELKTKIEVKYSYDHGLDDYTESTGWMGAKDYLGDGDLGYFNSEGLAGYSLGKYHIGRSVSLGGSVVLSEEETSEVFSARYLTERLSALNLQRFLILFNCNQHLIIDVDLPLKYLDIETGDVVQFNKLVDNKTAYGFNYVETEFYNGQEFYPYFIVTEVRKSTKNVRAKLVRLHNLTQRFYPKLGDVSRTGKSLDVEDSEALPDDGHLYPTELDLAMVADYIVDKTRRYTRGQILSMDINQSNGITWRDYNMLSEFVELGEIWGEEGE